MRKHLLELTAAALLVAAPAYAAGVTVTDGWFRALPGNAPAGGYFKMHNGGAQTTSLTGAESSACGMLMLHKSVDQGGTMQMMDVASVPVPPNGDVAFAPGGYHLMCMDPKPAMKPGAKVQVTLDFANGDKVISDFAVKNATGK